MSEPYDWVIRESNWVHWINSHDLNIDYSNKATWDPTTWGKWGAGKNGPPVWLPSGERFWYIDRRKIADFMFDHPGRKATIKKEGNNFALYVGYIPVWASEYEEVARAALMAFNAGDIPRLLAIEPPYVSVDLSGII